MAQNIAWLLQQGRRLGVRARLHHKLDYLWRSCTGELSEQNDLFRMTYLIEMAKEMDWLYRVLSDNEWAGRNALVMNGLFLSRSSLDIAFTEDGRQIMPLPAKVTGNLSGLEALLHKCGWRAEVCPDEKMPHLIRLMASGFRFTGQPADSEQED